MTPPPDLPAPGRAGYKPDMPDAEFPVSRCAICAKDVLCHLALAPDDVEIFRCVDCASEISRPAVRWVGFHDIEALGYGFVLPEAGCGRPDCGQGRCGRA